MKQALNVSRASILVATVAATAAMGLAACSESSEPTCNAALPAGHSELVWPSAPNKARIAYVGTLQENTGCNLGAGEAALSLQYPKSIATGNDRVYVSDREGVRAFDTTAGKMSAFASDVLNARGMAVAPDGRVFVADSGSTPPRIAVYSAANAHLADIGSDDLANPQGLAIDAERGVLYVADATLESVLSFSLDGKFLSAIESTPEQVIGAPTQVAVNSQGELYVVHQGWPKVLRFDAAGKPLGGFGDDGLYPGQFVRPKGLAIDSDDHVYVTDAAFDNIQIFDREGVLLLFLGRGGEGQGEFNLPFMMAIDHTDRIYVAEYGNHRVQVLQYLGDAN